MTIIFKNECNTETGKKKDHIEILNSCDNKKKFKIKKKNLMESFHVSIKIWFLAVSFIAYVASMFPDFLVHTLYMPY